MEFQVGDLVKLTESCKESFRLTDVEWCQFLDTDNYVNVFDGDMLNQPFKILELYQDKIYIIPTKFDTILVKSALSVTHLEIYKVVI